MDVLAYQHVVLVIVVSHVKGKPNKYLYRINNQISSPGPGKLMLGYQGRAASFSRGTFVYFTKFKDLNLQKLGRDMLGLFLPSFKKDLKIVFS